MFPIYSTRWDVGADRKRRRTPDEMKLIEEREAYAKRCAGLAGQYAGTARGAEYAAEASKWRMAARDARNGKFYPVK